MTAPLDGLRVLDLSHALAGPYAGRMLCDLGADVVKLEAPSGDQTRIFGEVRDGASSFYTQYNGGKRNICLDLRTGAAREVAARLAATADVVIENFRPGVLDRLGLGYEAVRKSNPGVVMLSISGFGQTAPDAHRPAYAPIIHAETGLVARQAAYAKAEPSDIVVSVADYNAGLHGLVATLAALMLRARTGEGQHVDISLLDAALATDDHAHSALNGRPAQFLGGEVWEAPGGPIMLGSVFRNTWSRLRATWGIADPGAGDRPLAEKIRLRRQSVADWIATRPTRQALTACLDEAGIAWGEIRTVEGAFDVSRLRQRGMIAEFETREGSQQRIIESPYRFSAAESGVRGVAAARGAHNAEVLSEWLGLTGAEIADLVESSALVADDAAAPVR